MKSLALAALSVAVLLVGCDSFEDCVLNKVSTASDQNVASMLREACAKKHQEQMPQAALSNLEGKAGQAMLGFVIHINNRNSDWILTEVEYHVSPDPMSPEKPYLQTVYIEPLSKDAFFPSIDGAPKDGDASFAWGISKAWGVPVKR